MFKYFYLLLALVIGCQLDSTPVSGSECKAGEQDLCVGPDRCVGTRACDAKGKWLACECAQPMAGGPAPQGGSPAPQAGVGGQPQPIAGSGGVINLPVAGSGGMSLPQGGTGGSTPIICDAGFELLQDVCRDINECLVGNGGCDLLRTCVNEPGSVSCGECSAGYTTDGATGCVDINECGTDNGGCGTNRECNNTAGGFNCGVCNSGYELDDDTCVDINECAQGNGGCGRRICIDTEGSFRCGLLSASFDDITIDTTTISITSPMQLQPIPTIRATLRNTNRDSDYTAPRVVIALVEPGQPIVGGRRIQALERTNVRIPADDGITLEVSNFDFPTDRPTGDWQLYTTHQDSAGAWHDGNVTKVEVSQVSLTEDGFGAWSSNAPVGSGEVVSARRLTGIGVYGILSNPNNFTISSQEVVWALRPSLGAHSSGPFLDLTPLSEFALQPGQSISIEGERLVRSSDPLSSSYDLYLTWKDKYSVWHDESSHIFEVTAASVVPGAESFVGPSTTATITQVRVVGQGPVPGTRLVSVSGDIGSESLLLVSRGFNCNRTPQLSSARDWDMGRYVGNGTILGGGVSGTQWSIELTVGDFSDPNFSIVGLPEDHVPTDSYDRSGCKQYPNLLSYEVF